MCIYIITAVKVVLSDVRCSKLNSAPGTVMSPLLGGGPGRLRNYNMLMAVCGAAPPLDTRAVC